MKRIALGLFHFNVQYVAGDYTAYHRYCVQAVIPFLRTVAANERYRLSFEMAGNGLEFLAQHYPRAIELLRRLVQRGQIELISATYAPTAWIAFPGRDLRRSIELNRQVLGKLELPAAAVFFAQEAFFGPGLAAIADLFPVVLCKDDYLRHFAVNVPARPIFALGDLRVVVGASHLLNEAARAAGLDGAGGAGGFQGFHRERLAEAQRALPDPPSAFVHGSEGDVEWRWYHMGSGHHLVNPGTPRDGESFFFDPGWTRRNTGLLDRLIEDGYRLGTIGELVQLFEGRPLPQLPAVIEGSWNPKESQGIQAWMGRQVQPWHDSSQVLGLAWRSRGALRACEDAVDRVADPSLRAHLTEQLSTIWRHQITAESSDPLGWNPAPVEAKFGGDLAEAALRMSGALLLEIEAHGPTAAASAPAPSGILDRPAGGPVPPGDELIPAQLVGAEGALCWLSLGPDLELGEAQFRAAGGPCGLRFRRGSGSVTYCPSGLESTPRTLELEAMEPPMFYLPLANGLVSTAPDRHLIRINQSGQTAVRVCRSDPWLEFAVEGAPKGKTYRWRFLAVRGPLDLAVRTANAVNQI